MDLSDKHALGGALRRLDETLGVAITSEIRMAYMGGRDPDLVGYEKTVGPRRELTAVAKHALVAWSYLMQPATSSYYDIFRAAHAVPVIRNLDIALRRLEDGRVQHLDPVIARLRTATDLDDLDSALFELATAARYGQRVGFERVSFVPENPPHSSPDIRVDLPSREFLIECKRFDRMTDATALLAERATTAASSVLEKLRSSGIAAVVEVIFTNDPSTVDLAELEAGARRALTSGASVVIDGARVASRAITPRKEVDCALYPSPKYFYEQYNYRRDCWHGIVPAVIASGIGPSWLDEVEWESAVLWRIDNDDLVWKMKRLGFDRLFKGLRQLRAAGKNTALHVWVERDVGLGHRQDQLKKFVEALESKDAFDFAWIIANETVYDVSVGGRFDFQEHASVINGDAWKEQEPPVTTVFIEDEDRRGKGEWGVGVVLPSIDEEAER